MYLTEMFGPTLQGEGILAGTMASFIRTAGCTVGCRTCDSKVSWPFGAHPKKPHDSWSVNRIMADVEGWGVRYVVITGGDPMETENPEALLALCEALYRGHYHTTIELSGSIAASDELIEGLTRYVNLWSFSPKVASMRPIKLPNPTFIHHTLAKAYSRRDSNFGQLKFVVDLERWDQSLGEIGVLLGALSRLHTPRVPVLFQTLTLPKDKPADILERQRLIFERLSKTHATLDFGQWRAADIRVTNQMHALVGVR